MEFYVVILIHLGKFNDNLMSIAKRNDNPLLKVPPSKDYKA
jgi:hypothetical protein